MKLRNVIAGIALMSLASSVIAGLDKGYAAYAKGDYKTALQEFKLSAERGNSGAQFATGVMFANARGVPQDYKEAADQGNADAQFWLGSMFDQGHGVNEDDKEAVKWYRLAAEQCDSAAQYNLAFLYQEGEGVAHDFIQAYAWFSISAENGVKDALAGSNEVARNLTQAQLAKAKYLAAEYHDRFLMKRARSAIYQARESAITSYLADL